jgi:hypothetical protein
VRWTSTTVDFRKARWLLRPGLFASALFLCTEGCTAEYALNTLPGNSTDQPIAPVSLTEGIYATDGLALYTFSPDTGGFSDRTPFVQCDLRVVEITLDDKGAMYAAGFENGLGALYQVDAPTGKCTAVRRFPTDAPWSLGFLNKNLFGDEAGALVRLDTTSGMETVINATVSSKREGCDIVQRADGSTYLSALLDRTSPVPANVLEHIDPDTGLVFEQLDVPAGMVMEGLAEAGGVLYGFFRDGRVFRIGLDADTVQLKIVTTSGGPLHFTGAASMLASTPR